MSYLRGVGDIDRGEWVEEGEKAVHVRRRLSAEEEALVGPVVDVRCTPEGLKRTEALLAVVPWAATMANECLPPPHGDG